MILPIFAYGQPVLKKKATAIDASYPDLKELIDNMWETMYNADGVGLAAPQIGLGIRLFVIDTVEVERKGGAVETDTGLKQVFLNAEILDLHGPMWTYEEGCLSIPRITGDVERPPEIRIRWQDEEWKEHEAVFTGINARVIQHEYDHIEGVLFVEKLKPIKKRLIQRRLDEIKTGKIKTDYRMRFFTGRQ